MKLCEFEEISNGDYGCINCGRIRHKCLCLQTPMKLIMQGIHSHPDCKANHNQSHVYMCEVKNVRK